VRRAAAWVPEDATDIHLLQRTTGDERIVADIDDVRGGVHARLGGERARTAPRGQPVGPCRLPLPQGPAAPASPVAPSTASRSRESAAAGVDRQRPRCSQVTGRVAGTAPAEVDDGGQATVVVQEVAGGDVTAEPDPARPRSSVTALRSNTPAPDGETSGSGTRAADPLDRPHLTEPLAVRDLRIQRSLEHGAAPEN
jgi:hypothetical protein